MSTTTGNSQKLTPEAYFAWEAQQLEKHEYIDGEVYAMSGGSVNHGRISLRFTALFDAHCEKAREKGLFGNCRVAPLHLVVC